MQLFTGPRLAALNGNSDLRDDRMRAALLEALEPREVAVASYSVSAHIWIEAVLTDRALLLVKGAVHARVTRMPLPVTALRTPSGSRSGVRLETSLGKKTLWGSKLDPEGTLLVAAAGVKPFQTDTPPTDHTCPAPRVSVPTRQEERRVAGPRPRKPRRQRVRRTRIGFAPASTVWDMAHRCVKCGRPLTDPRSQRARVGTKCIRIYGSQQRRIVNPARADWLAKKTKAEVDYLAAKVRAEADFARAMEAYETAKLDWLNARSRA
ncbi:DUF6011 domain-containing protein [Nocardioides zeae]